jgi:ribonuclease R
VREADLPAQVLRALGAPGRPVLSVRDIGRRLGGRGGLAKTLRAALRGLIAEGKVQRLDEGYRLRRQDGLVEGVLAPARTGAAPDAGVGVRDEDGRSWTLSDAGEAKPGDRVLIQPLGDGASGHAELVQVLVSERREWIGVVERGGRGYRLTPYRDEGSWAWPIAPRDLAGARVGEVVVARPVAAGAHASGRLRVSERLGEPGDPEARFRVVAWRQRLPMDFSPAALAEAEAAPAELPRAELARRRDMRDLCFVTIDPETARDHDDAICLETGDAAGPRLLVAIADVSHYVPERSALDREAWLRGNSVYLPGRAIPMLPPRLSGDLCSLRPERDRLALVVEMRLGRGGAVEHAAFHEAVIRSRARLSYAEAAKWMDERRGSKPTSEQPEWAEPLRALAEITARMTRRRLDAGALDFDLAEAEVMLDAKERPTDIRRAVRTVAHRAVEESMLAANRAVAKALDRASEPAVFRIHEPPSPRAEDELRGLYATFGLLEGAADGPLGPKQICAVLRRAAGRPEERVVNMAPLRAMKRARYADTDSGHFGLAFESYLHFTSPIRRYADLVVHRAVRRRLVEGAAAPRVPTGAEADPEAMERVAIRVSARERIAMAAEREGLTLARCALMRPHVGSEFAGVVTGVAEQGLYVTLDEVFVEGLIPVARLEGYFDFDARAFALVARDSGQRFKLGDAVKVRLDAVDQLKGWINFSLVTDRKKKANSTGRRGQPARRKAAPTRRSGRRSRSGGPAGRR